MLTAPGTDRWKLKCHEPLSSFAFNINVCRYMKAVAEVEQKKVYHSEEVGTAE
jgi:hypothetical protein